MGLPSHSPTFLQRAGALHEAPLRFYMEPMSRRFRAGLRNRTRPLYRTGMEMNRRKRMSETVEIQAEDTSTTGYLALPADGNGPGVLLMHAWWGLNSYFKSLADRLANEGYVVLAPDIYGGKIASEIEDAEKLIGELEKDQGYHKAIKVEEAALDYLLNHPSVTGDKIGAIGFSMGATYASWLATLRPEVTAVVLFYGGFFGGDQGPDYATQSEDAFLGHFAEGDEWEPDEGVKEQERQLQAAGREAKFHFYPGASHWFMEDNRPDNYNAEAAQLAWERTVQFLKEKLT